MGEHAGAKPTPKPVSDETLVSVITPVGQDVGSFCWPTKHLHLLMKVNDSPEGNYLCWNLDNDLTKSVVAHKTEGN